MDKRRYLILGVLASGIAMWSNEKKVESPEALLGAAIHQQEAEGNLEAAVALYQKILTEFASHRALAAKAQLRLGDCYEKLGQAEARQAYEKVVAAYADQVEVAAQARARLARMARASSRPEMTNRRVFGLSNTGHFCSTSPDERYVAYFESSQNRSGLVLRDLASGKERLLTQKGFVSRFVAFSPDSRTVAFHAADGQLRLVNSDGTGERVLMANPEITGCSALDWSPDGRQILTAITRRDESRQLALVSAASGALRVLTTFDWQEGQPVVARFSPDGAHVAYSLRARASNSDSRRRPGSIYILAVDGAQETDLVRHRAWDEVVGWATDGRIVFTSNRRGPTELWAIRVAEGRGQGDPELIPRQLPDPSTTNSIILARSGALHYSSLRQRNDAYLVELDAASGMLKGKPALVAESRPGTTLLPAFSPDGRQVAVLNQARGRMSIMLRSLQTGEERAIAASGFMSGYQMLWARDGRSLLIQGEAANRWGVHRYDLNGNLTHLQPQQRSTLRVAGFATSADGRRVLVLQSADDTIVLKSIDPATGDEVELHSQKRGKSGTGSLSPSGRRLVLYTFAGPTSLEPSLTVMDIDEKRMRTIVTEEPLKIVSEMAWAPDDQSVLFFGLGNPGSSASRTLWRLSLEDGKASRLGAIDVEGAASPVAVHPDGRLIALSATTKAADYWVTESILPLLKAFR